MPRVQPVIHRLKNLFLKALHYAQQLVQLFLGKKWRKPLKSESHWLGNPSKRTRQDTTISCPRPLMSWVIPGQLAVGKLPRSEDRTKLVRADIKTVLTLCAEQEGQLPEDIIRSFLCRRFVLPDSHYTTELTIGELNRAVELVRECILQRQAPVYVHCLAGIERSPTVCVAYLCRYHCLELWEAMNWLKQVHPQTALNESQLRALRDYAQQRLQS